MFAEERGMGDEKEERNVEICSFTQHCNAQYLQLAAAAIPGGTKSSDSKICMNDVISMSRIWW